MGLRPLKTSDLVDKWQRYKTEPFRGRRGYDYANNLVSLTGLPSAVLPGRDLVGFLGIALCLRQ